MMRAEPTHEAQPEPTTPAEIPQGPKVVRYLIGGWNTALGALFILIGLGLADILTTFIGTFSVTLGVAILIGPMWAFYLSAILTAIGVFGGLILGGSYGISVGVVQGLLFWGLLYAKPSFGRV